MSILNDNAVFCLHQKPVFPPPILGDCEVSTVFLHLSNAWMATMDPFNSSHIDMKQQINTGGINKTCYGSALFSMAEPIQRVNKHKGSVLTLCDLNGTELSSLRTLSYPISAVEKELLDWMANYKEVGKSHVFHSVEVTVWIY